MQQRKCKSGKRPAEIRQNETVRLTKPKLTPCAAGLCLKYCKGESEIFVLKITRYSIVH